MPYVISESQQLDITEEEAKILVREDYIYRADPEYSLDYYTTPWNVSLDSVAAFLRGYRHARKDAQ